MSKAFKTVLLVVLQVLFFSCGESDSPTNSTPNDQPFISDQTYTNQQIGLVVTFPEGWTMQMDVPVSGYDATLFAEKTTSSGIPPNIAIICQESNSRPTMEVLLSGVADQLPGMLENVNILDHNVTQKNGIECGEIVYTFTDQEITYKQKQLYYFNKIFIIVITFRLTRRSLQFTNWRFGLYTGFNQIKR